MAQFIEYGDYKQIVDKVSKIKMDNNKWFPPPVAEWIHYNATLLGVPDTYISYPLVSAVCYCAQHAIVELEDGMHQEPVLIYGLVGGRSGTNKSGALRKVTDIVMEIENPNLGSHVFDTGTTEGLMKAMHDNGGTILSAKDEFASFNDAFDKTSNNNMERSRFLSLYSCTNWSRTTKTNGTISMADPRFNLISFNQPFYLVNFARSSTMDGFFQRFMTSVPKEMMVKRSEKKAMKKEYEDKSMLDMKNLLELLYKDGSKKQIKMVIMVGSEAERLYDAHHDEAVDFRSNDLFEERKVSVKSKAVGLAMRLAGVICLMRVYAERALHTTESEIEHEEKDEDKPDTQELDESILPAGQSSPVRETIQDKEEDDDMIIEVTDGDFEMAVCLTQYSVSTSFALFSGEEGFNIFNESKTKKKKIQQPKPPIPEPENVTMEYLLKQITFTQKFLNVPIVSMSEATRNKWYPPTDEKGEGRVKSFKFASGLQHLGLGCLSPGKKHFKRIHYEDEDCEDSENLKKRYKMLNL